MYLNYGTLIRYKYQITPNTTNSYGGADMWADIQSTEVQAQQKKIIVEWVLIYFLYLVLV